MGKGPVPCFPPEFYLSVIPKIALAGFSQQENAFGSAGSGIVLPFSRENSHGNPWKNKNPCLIHAGMAGNSGKLPTFPLPLEMLTQPQVFPFYPWNFSSTHPLIPNYMHQIPIKNFLFPRENPPGKDIPKGKVGIEKESPVLDGLLFLIFSGNFGFGFSALLALQKKPRIIPEILASLENWESKQPQNPLGLGYFWEL